MDNNTYLKYPGFTDDEFYIRISAGTYFFFHPYSYTLITHVPLLLFFFILHKPPKLLVIHYTCTSWSLNIANLLTPQYHVLDTYLFTTIFFNLKYPYHLCGHPL